MKKIILLSKVLFFCLQIAVAQIPKPDTSFGNNGLITSIYEYYNSSHFGKILVQPDQTFYIIHQRGQDFSFISKQHADGSIDKTYGTEGFSDTVNMYGRTAALQPDGKLVLAGAISNSNGFALSRFNTDGTLDKSFAGDGIQTTRFKVSTACANAAVIQSDGKILIAGFAANYSGDEFTDWAMARYNRDGTLDTSFSGNGVQTFEFGNRFNLIYDIKINKNGKIVAVGNSAIAHVNTNGTLDSSFANSGIKMINVRGGIAFQSDDKIVAGTGDGNNSNKIIFKRYNDDGSADSSFSNQGNQYNIATSVAVQSNGKIIVGGTADLNGEKFALVRYNTNGALDSAFGYKGIELTQPTPGENNEVNYITISNNRLYVEGLGSDTTNLLDVLQRYLLDDKTETLPTITIAAPLNNSSFLSPANIHITAAVRDPEGIVGKVKFYNGSKLIATVSEFPFSFIWKNVPLGNYALTAKALYGAGLSITSAAVHISVIPNKPPLVSIIKPANNQSFAAPAYIHFEAAASDSDGRITSVEFYNGSTLLRTENKSPYTYVWKNVPEGTYTITAIATDNWGAKTTSAPITVRVTSAGAIVSSRPYSENEKTALNDALSLRLSPNPARSVLNIFTSGLQQYTPVTLSIISTSGIVVKTINISKTATQLDVSFLTNGVYTVKIISENKVLTRHLVKL